MTERTKLTLVALASAAMPDAYFTGARASDQANITDEADGIDCAVVQNASGRLYDIWATSTEQGKARLSKRVKAAEALEDIRGIRALGFGVEQVLSYQPGVGANSPTGDVAVAIMTHTPGHTQSLKLLTNEECAAVGTAIAAIHRIDPQPLRERFYPAFNTREITVQLSAWINSLKHAGHVPSEITDSWSRIIDTEGLWSFNTCMVHGGFSDGDLLFSNTGLTAIHNWQNMQVNDPARDLAWMFAKLDQNGRDAVIAAYGRMMGSRMDDLIMLRANLWLQMEQVGDFILALEQADNDKIIRFKAQVERLAEQLADRAPRSFAPASGTGNVRQPNPTGRHSKPVSKTATPQSKDSTDTSVTMTVGSLPQESSQLQEATPSPQLTAADIDDDATVARPVYRKTEQSLRPGNATSTGRHAAVKAPTLPDMTGSHQSSSTDFVAPEEALSVDVPASTGKHMRIPQSGKESKESEPHNLKTEAIQQVDMSHIAQQQTEEAHQRKKEPADQGQSAHNQDADEAVSSTSSGTQTIIINPHQVSEEPKSAQTQLVARPAGEDDK